MICSLGSRKKVSCTFSCLFFQKFWFNLTSFLSADELIFTLLLNELLGCILHVYFFIYVCQVVSPHIPFFFPFFFPSAAERLKVSYWTKWVSVFSSVIIQRALNLNSPVSALTVAHSLALGIEAGSKSVFAAPLLCLHWVTSSIRLVRPLR